MTIEEAKKLDHFVCSECSSDDDMKKPQATFPLSPADDSKVRLPVFNLKQFRNTSILVPNLLLIFSLQLYAQESHPGRVREGEEAGGLLICGVL